MEWFAIVNLDSFVNSTRVLVYELFGNQDKEKNDSVAKTNTDYEKLTSIEKKEINECLTHQESLLISKEFITEKESKKLKKKRYIISDKDYLSFLESLNARLVSNMLSKMVKQDLLDTAFDEESNDFVFWLKEEEEENNEKDKNTKAD
jgi:tRNA C32,U32 (ribose-2'-O)-methylase TrmJ